MIKRLLAMAAGTLVCMSVLFTRARRLRRRNIGHRGGA